MHLNELGETAGLPHNIALMINF